MPLIDPNTSEDQLFIVDEEEEEVLFRLYVTSSGSESDESSSEFSGPSATKEALGWDE